MRAKFVSENLNVLLGGVLASGFGSDSGLLSDARISANRQEWRYLL